MNISLKCMVIITRRVVTEESQKDSLPGSLQKKEKMFEIFLKGKVKVCPARMDSIIYSSL